MKQKPGELIADEGSSISGFRWRLFQPDERFVEAARQRHGIPDIIAKIINARGVGLEAVPDYMQPQLRHLLPEPLTLSDMEAAAERIARAVEAGETIGIFGDYDVDGATSSAILCRFLREAGAGETLIHIPDRQREGYGLNAEGLRELHEKGCTLVVAADCGITGFEEAKAAKALGLDLVIADHHEAEAGLPEAVAAVDPKRIDDSSGLSFLAACGVVFLLAVAVNRKLRENGHYTLRGRPEPDLMSYLDLVALGTVCDVVPAVGANRALISAGLKVMARRKNPGLKALCDAAGISAAPSAFHLGYILGPRINAGGRVGDASIGARLLTTDDRVEAERLAGKLEAFNSERKDIEAAVLSQALQKIGEDGGAEGSFIFVAGRGWHTGVIGIIAGRIKERYNLPTCVATIDGEGNANGSGRSVEGVDIGSAIIKAKELGILLEGGGHSMAAGFTLRASKIGEFKEFLSGYVAEVLGGAKAASALCIDAAIDISGITAELAVKLQVLEPFGPGNEEPRFAVMNAKLSGADAVGGGNVRCYFSSDNGRSVSAICYKAVGTKLGETLLSRVGGRFKVAGKIRLNEWNGKREAQLVLDDAAIG